jgi:elongation factor G
VKVFDTAAIRNVAIVGHSKSGKTSLGDALLYTAGASTRHGKVQDGSSLLQHTVDEVKRQVSIYLSLAQFAYKDCKINLIDCPGYADFIGEVYAGLAAADTALVVVNATAGVEGDTEKHFDLISELGMPAFFVVNMMDKEEANFAKAVESIRGITDRAVPCAFPIGSGGGFKGVVEALKNKATLGDSKSPKEDSPPAELAGPIEEAMLQLTELAAESDDTLLEKYLDSGELSPEEIMEGFRKGIAQGKIFPIFAAAADPNVATSVILDSLVDLAPAPTEATGRLGLRPGASEEAPIKGNSSDPLAALVFKVTSEIIPQDLFLIRVFSGQIEKGMEVYNSRRDQSDRMSQLYHFCGKDRVDAERIVAGDIGATVNLKTTSVNDCLCSKDAKIVLSPINFPAPVHEVAVAPTKKGEEEKIGSWLSRLAGEDPTIQSRGDSDLHQTLVRCMGDLHVDVLLERMKRRGQVDVVTGKPRIPYRETIQGNSDVSYRHKKQTGGRGQFADVSIKVEPLPRGSGFEFVNEIVGGVIPSKFIPAVEKGLVEKMGEGVVAGYPVVDLRVRLHFGGYHDVDSSEMAFKIAAKMALKDGVEKARPVLLEPIMKVEVNVPDDYMGDVMGDLSSRRGKILGMESATRGKQVVAMVPQAELYQYSTKLRSMTQGRGRFAFEFDHYEEVPREVQGKLVEQLRKEQEEANA